MVLQPTVALALDLAVGEPPERWHPVCWMGRVIGAAERAFLGGQEVDGGSRALRLAGGATVLVLTAGTYGTVRFLLRLLPPGLSAAAEAVLLAVSLAASSLYASARAVEDGLVEGLETGRRRVSRMVGRDTVEMGEDDVVRAAVESVAENTNDAVIAPLFYGMIGGAPLALAYKMVNTLDSMVGYRDRRYRDFGWAAARLDDLAGYIPARLTGLAVAVASPLAGGDAAGAISAWRADAGAHGSPNAGVCESAYAGALGVSLGGTGHYGGRRVDTPVMGGGNRRPDRNDIGRAARLMYMSAALFCAGGAAVAWLSGRFTPHGRVGR